MIDVFISYRSTQLQLARAVAGQLTKRGLTVWYDDALRAGADYREQIGEALRTADAVLVLWTEDAVASPWVNDEARQGRERGRLLSVQIGKAQPSANFRSTIAYRLPDGERSLTEKNLNRLADIVASSLTAVRHSDSRFTDLSKATVMARVLDLSSTLLCGCLIYSLLLGFSFDFDRPYEMTDGRQVTVPFIVIPLMVILIAAIQSPYAILGSWIFDAVGKRLLKLNFGPSNKRLMFRWLGEAVGWAAPWWALFAFGLSSTAPVTEELKEFGPAAPLLSFVTVSIAAVIAFMIGLLPKFIPFFLFRSLRSGLLR